MGLTSFWSGVPLAGPCIAGWAPAPGAPVPGGDLQLVTPVRVLDTRTGAGLEEPCRLSAPRWSGDRTDLVVDVTGVGEVPETGVAAVALRVHATRGSALRYTVSARATADQPAVPLLSTALTAPASGTVVVPVAADGTVRLVLDAGTTDVLVDVLGWAPAAAPAVPTRVGTAGAMRLVAPFSVEDAWTTPLKPKETRTIALAGRGGLPASGLTGLTFSVEAGTTTAPALVDVLRTDPRSQVGRVRTSTSTAAVSLVVSPTVDGTIQLRNLSSVPVPLRLRVFAWSGSGAGGRSLVVGTTPVPVVDTTKGLGLTGPAPSRTGRTVTVTGNSAAPTGATAVLVSISTYGGSTAGVAAVKGRVLGPRHPAPDVDPQHRAGPAERVLAHPGDPGGRARPHDGSRLRRLTPVSAPAPRLVRRWPPSSTTSVCPPRSRRRPPARRPIRPRSSTTSTPSSGRPWSTGAARCSSSRVPAPARPAC
jgi:hypothetical protein